MINELNLTPPQAVIFLFIIAVLMYFTITAKPSDSSLEAVEVKPTEKPSLAYLERYGAYMQAQNQYYN